MERHEWRQQQAHKVARRMMFGLILNLDDLYETLCDLDRWGVIEEERQEAGLILLESDRTPRPELIPIFDGCEGDDTAWLGGGAISWDRTRMLIGGPGDWEIVDRAR